MKNMVKKESGEFERQFESQREEKKVKISRSEERRVGKECM